MNKIPDFARNISPLQAALVLGGGLFSTFIWEHVCRKQGSNKKPSVAITWAATKSQELWSFLGKKFAWISSFYELIDLKDLKQTLSDLLKPTWDFMSSPVYAAIEYSRQAKLYQHPYMIGFGSATLVLGIAFGAYYFDGATFFQGVVGGVYRHLPALPFTRKIE